MWHHSRKKQRQQLLSSNAAACSTWHRIGLGVRTADSGRAEDEEGGAGGALPPPGRSPRDLPVSTSVIRVVRVADVHPGPAVPGDAVVAPAPAAVRQAETDAGHNARDPEPTAVPPTPVAA